MTEIQYKIGEKEYSASHPIKTTMFLERCRLLHFAADILLAYKIDDNFREGVDDQIGPFISNFTISGILLANSLNNVLDEWLDSGWFEPHELGE